MIVRLLIASAARQRMLGECPLGDWRPAREVFVDKTWHLLRGHTVIPDAFGINDGDGALNANAQAIHLAPIDHRFRLDQVQFLEAPLQIIPGLQAFLFRRAFGVGLVGAEGPLIVICVL